MILELLEKLIDRCLQLLEIRSEHNHSLLDNHVEPVMGILSDLHEGYIKIFQEAHEAIAIASDPIKETRSVASKLQSASLFESTVRSKLLSVISASNKNSKLTNLIDSINAYLVASSFWLFDPPSDIEYNEYLILGRKEEWFERYESSDDAQREYTRVVRDVVLNVRASLACHFETKLHSGVGDISSFREERLREIEAVVAHLQLKYQKVQTAYQSLRQQLLN